MHYRVHAELCGLYQSLLAILTRATNAGSRGWEATLLLALKESEGAVRVCMQCIAVAVSGPISVSVIDAGRWAARDRLGLSLLQGSVRV